ncbi:MAG: GHKL domain-containing protein [Bdellovibrionales bacterium]|nr:GHKL domain-containing protein [Bdellovibrionales bacterium]MCB0406590.1 GHKL domain-containing protein [Bdellovibrionales bacterium]
MKITKKLLLTSLIPLTILAIGGLFSIFIVKKTQDSIMRSIAQINEKQTLISDIYNELGYGNGIHAFKNYVLRGQDVYKKNAASHLIKANQMIDKYFTFKNLSLDEKQALEILRNTVTAYISKIDIINQKITEGKIATEIDKLVKIDDAPAVSAQGVLQKYLLTEKSAELKKIDDLNHSVFFYIISIYLISLIIALFISQKISSKLIQSINRLIRFSSDISKGFWTEKNNSPIVVSDDEFQTLADQMFNMKKDLLLIFERLKQTNQDLEQFSFMSAHDLKTPLKNLLSYTELINDSIDQKDCDALETFTQEVRNEAEKMMDYISDLLSFTRLGAESLNIDDVDVKAVIREITSTFNHSTKEIELIALGVPDFIRADRLKFTRILQNLLENSIKYSNDHVRIEITGKTLDSGGWLFTVEDNGKGIRERDFEKIFLPFRRATDQGEGTGIGLAIVKKIIEIHGGKIWLESKENTFTKFHFSIGVYKNILPDEKEVNNATSPQHSA